MVYSPQNKMTGEHEDQQRAQYHGVQRHCRLLLWAASCWQSGDKRWQRLQRMSSTKTPLCSPVLYVCGAHTDVPPVCFFTLPRGYVPAQLLGKLFVAWTLISHWPVLGQSKAAYRSGVGGQRHACCVRIHVEGAVATLCGRNWNCMGGQIGRYQVYTGQ